MAKQAKKAGASSAEPDVTAPIGAPRKAVTLPPSEFGKAREEEMAAAQPAAIAERQEKEETAKRKKK